MVYCYQNLNPRTAANLINGLTGVEKVLSREMACKELELPPDLVGDLIVLGDEHTVLGSTPTAHDLSALKGARLRSHGGLAEQGVPFILSRPLTTEYAALAASRPLRNFDIFDFVLNGTP
jgi:phosphonoacetate hydrolase